MKIGDFKKEQLKLAKGVSVKDDFDEINLIGGVDQIIIGNKVISAVTVCDYNNLKLLDDESFTMETKVPYILGCLFYREGPAAVEAFHKLKRKPDVLLVDAHGVLHPRKIGMASQLGLVLNIPTIGVAKNLLVGEVRDNGDIFILGKKCGKKVITKEGANPLYVSPGYRVSLKTAVEIVKKCMREPHKLPEPLFLAHKIARKKGKELLN